MGRRISDDVAQQAAEMHRRGASVRSIAAILGIDRAAAGGILKRAGLEVGRGQRRKCGADASHSRARSPQPSMGQTSQCETNQCAGEPSQPDGDHPGSGKIGLRHPYGGQGAFRFSYGHAPPTEASSQPAAPPVSRVEPIQSLRQAMAAIGLNPASPADLKPAMDQRLQGFMAAQTGKAEQATREDPSDASRSPRAFQGGLDRRALSSVSPHDALKSSQPEEAPKTFDWSWDDDDDLDVADERRQDCLEEPPDGNDADVGIDWSQDALDEAMAAIGLNPASPGFPVHLRAAHVRLLRDLVAVRTSQERQALRIGIDRWCGREVASPEDLKRVLAEIAHAVSVRGTPKVRRVQEGRRL